MDQKELFEFEKPKKLFPKFGMTMPRGDFALTLTLEKLVFLGIGVIMIMVVIYALGVERGKAVIRINTAAVTSSAPVRTAPSVQKPPVAPVRIMAVDTVEPVPVRVKPSKSYAIVAASFTRKEWAQAESDHLRKKGYDAFVIESTPYFVVCVGSYSTREKAKFALKKVRLTYKDAYLKAR